MDTTTGAPTAADRCDRCGAQAYVRAVLPAGRDLVFCGHHGRRFEPHLLALGAAVHDGTAALEPTHRALGTEAHADPDDVDQQVG